MVGGTSNSQNPLLSQLPVLAISPPTRPHTPQPHVQYDPNPFTPSPSRLKDYTTASDLPDHHGNDNFNYYRPQTPPPPPPPPPPPLPLPLTTQTHQRPRSYSIKNGLLSPDPFVPSSSSSSSSSSSPRTILTGASPISSPESQWSNWGSSPKGSVVSSYTDSGATVCESPTESSFDYKNPFVSSASSVMSLASSLPSANGQVDHETGAADEGGLGKTVYHIYHAGALSQSFSIHLKPDSISKPKKDKIKKKNTKEKEEDKGEEFATEIGLPSTGNNDATSTVPTPKPDTTTPVKSKSKTKTKTKSLHYWEETEVDPRVPTYFLHQPRLNNHLPGMTLRWAGDGRDYIREKYHGAGKVKKSKKEAYRKRDMKYAPVVCQIRGDPVWRKWEIEYTVLVPRPDDPVVQKPSVSQVTWSKSLQCINQGNLNELLKDAVFRGKHTKDKSGWIYRGLNERGVVDGRGLISTWYPFKKGPFSWRASGETGKEWVEKEVERRKKLKGKSTSDIGAKEDPLNQEDDDDNLVLLPPEKLPRHLWPIQLDPVPGSSQSPARSPQHSQNVANQDPKIGPPNPSKVTMRWSNILSREYEFTYLNTNFYWRGTKEVNHYATGKENTESEVGPKEKISKNAVEEARKKKGMDVCIWAHLKLVVCLPKDIVESWGNGKNLGLLGDKRSMNASAKGGGVDDKKIVDEVGEFRRVKRRSSSFSSFWNGITRQDSIADGSPFTDGGTRKQSRTGKNLDDREDAEQNLCSKHDPGIPSASVPNQPLSRRNSFFQNVFPSRPTTPITSTITNTLPTTPPRTSTWGTSTSATTLVPWVSRTFASQSHTSTTSLFANESSNDKGKASSSSSSSLPSPSENVEVVVARYFCVMGARKAGRLVVDEEALEMVAGYLFGRGFGGGKVKGNKNGRVIYVNPPSPSPPHNTLQKQNQSKMETETTQLPTHDLNNINLNYVPQGEKKNEAEEQQEEEEEDIYTQKERLRHLIVATGLCMIMGERQKRDTLKEIILAVIDGASGAGG